MVRTRVTADDEPPAAAVTGFPDEGATEKNSSLTAARGTRATAAAAVEDTTSACGDYPSQDDDKDCTGLTTRSNGYVLYCYTSMAVCVTLSFALVACCLIGKNGSRNERQTYDIA